MTKKHAEYLAILFFVGVVAVVFQQVATSMAEQGIASGSPYDNAAAYPRAVAILVGFLLALQAAITWRAKASGAPVALEAAGRPIALLAIFAIYLFSLGWLGYHLSTPPMLMALLWLAGYRRPLMVILYGFAISFGAAFLFEVFLKIVLPGGIWRLNIPW